MPLSPVIVLGSINTDLIVRAPRLPAPGETVLGGQYYQAAGGKGANQAVAAARAGQVTVTLIAAVGDDVFGGATIDRLAADGIRTDFVKTVPGSASGVALIMVDDAGENCITVASGANGDLTVNDVRKIPAAVFSECKVFLANLESPLETVLCGLERARVAGLTTILNPAPALFEISAQEVLESVDIITPNSQEATMLTGIEVVDHHSAIAAGHCLQQCGCRTAIITRGANGCSVIAEDTSEYPAESVKAIDATGAGDAFNGALAAALSQDKALHDAVRWATAAAGLSVTQLGAQPSLPEHRDILARLAG